MYLEILAGLSVMLAFSVQPEENRAIKVGDPVPDFRMIGSDDNWYTPDPNQAMVIAWFPKAFTSG